MPTSLYQADIDVHIAWDGGFRVPMVDWTWTDVSDYVELREGIGIQWGRSDERSTADANTITLTLDNSDGRFTAGLTTGAYYPDVVLYKPIRVTIDPVDGAAFTAVGYVTSWPLEWNGTSAYAKASVTASSRLSRLGLNAAWRSLVEETFLADSPVAYYPLGEPEGATLAADVSGLGAAPLTLAGNAALPIVFGQATGPPTDDLTAATFAGGQYLTVPAPTVLGGSSEATIEAFFLVAAGASGDIVSGSAGAEATLSVLSTGELQGSVNATVLQSTATVDDGSTHHAAMTRDAAGVLTLYLDGVSVDSAAGAPLIAWSDFWVGEGLTGVIAHAALYDTALSSTRVLAHATAGSSGFAGDLTSARLERYAGMVGIPTAEVDAETGVASMAHVDTTGSQVVDMLRLCETTEGGVVFDALDGMLTMHNRSHRYTAASVFTLDMDQGEVESDYRPVLDPSMLANDVTVTSPVTSARIKDDVSIEANGLANPSVTIADEDDDAPLQYASWAVYVFKDPKVRTPTLSVDALAQVGKTPNCAAVLSATIGDKVTVSNHPDQAAASSVDYFIEGGSFSIGPESFVVTWNVTPSSPDDTVFILGSVSRGVLGTNPLAF